MHVRENVVDKYLAIEPSLMKNTESNIWRESDKASYRDIG